jgi:hypothetical protein
MRMDGSGIIDTSERGSILHTWFYDAKYEMENGELSEILKDGYVTMGAIAYTKVELPLQASPDDVNVIYTTGENEMVLLTLTDNERWLCVEAGGGIKGWIEIQDFSYIKSVDKYGDEVFEGLSYAD